MTSNENLYGSEYSHFYRLYGQYYRIKYKDEGYGVLNLLTNEDFVLCGKSPKEAIKNFAKIRLADYRIYESYEEMSSECISYAEKYTLLTKKDNLKYFSLHSAKILKELSYADSLKYSINTADTFRNIAELAKSLKKNNLISYYKITDNDGDGTSQGKVVVIRSLYCGVITKTYKSVVIHIVGDDLGIYVYNSTDEPFKEAQHIEIFRDSIKFIDKQTLYGYFVEKEIIPRVKS